MSTDPGPTGPNGPWQQAQRTNQTTYQPPPGGPQPTAPWQLPPGSRSPSTRPRLRTVLLFGLIATGFLLSATVLTLEFQSAFGLQVTLLAALVAAVPLLVVVPTYLWLDRYEAEPTRLLVFAFAWGALCAAAGALFLNTSFVMAMRLAGNEDVDAVTTVFAAPFVEEAMKGLGVLLVILLHRKEFDGVVDGIVYAGLVGAGFAFSENILYLGRGFTEYGEQGLTQVFILRCLMGPFAHPLFTACTGIGLGLAVAAVRTPIGRVATGLAGYLCAAVLHGMWNLTAITGHAVGAYFLFQVPMFLAFLGLVVSLRVREGRLIRQYLSQYADAGWLSHPEVAMLSSIPARRWARSWAQQQGGRQAVRAMRAFQDTASDLALLRSRMVRGTAERDAPAHERGLLDALSRFRLVFVGPHPG